MTSRRHTAIIAADYRLDIGQVPDTEREDTAIPTLDQAARQLGISEKTLRRWLRLVDPPIEAAKHPLDGRYRTISADELARVADLRAQLPGSSPVIPSYSLPAFRRRQSGEETSSDTPVARPARALRPVVSVASLPDGLMSRTDAADLHGVPRSTLRRWCEEGRIETASESYGGQAGQFATVAPVTAAGLAMLYALAHRRPDFRACPDCPHSAT